MIPLHRPGGLGFHVARTRPPPAREPGSALPVLMACILAGVLLVIHAAARAAP